MKSKVIITCVCLGMLGSTVSCAGEDEATQASAETAVAEPEASKAQKPAAKPAKPKARPAPKREEAAPEGGKSALTNAECFPESLPDSAPNTAKLCVGLAQSAPDMVFTKRDFEGMPEDCKPIVLPHCRFGH
jgi:hypothetical protein